MDTQTQGMKGARTFVLGMLAGATVVAGGLVLARGPNLNAPNAAIIQSDALSSAGRDAAARQTSAEVPAVDLTRALVVGHRLKILVSVEQGSKLSLASTFIS